MKKILFAAVGLFALVGASSAAQAYKGDWSYDDNAGGWEVLVLGDNQDGTSLHLSGTKSACGARGARYQTMRSVMHWNNGQQIEWWVDVNCGSYLRICVQNIHGNTACSTYYKEGWW